jgi:small subunit ribosomal protein S6e
MPDYKIVFGLKDGRSVQKEIKEPESRILAGKKVGDTVKGEEIGFSGYEFKITGGSDNAGFPMRWDAEGTMRRKMLAVQGIGLKKKANGIRTRKTITGNTVGAQTAQINMKVMVEGKEALIPPAEAPKTDA